jgi:hypothetical protein
LAEYYGLAREDLVPTIDNYKKGTDQVGLSLAGHVGFQEDLPENRRGLR